LQIDFKVVFSVFGVRYTTTGHTDDTQG
jgi:hypothetical protein